MFKGTANESLVGVIAICQKMGQLLGPSKLCRLVGPCHVLAIGANGLAVFLRAIPAHRIKVLQREAKAIDLGCGKPDSSWDWFVTQFARESSNRDEDQG